VIRATESSSELCEERFLHYKFQASKEEKKDIHGNHQKTICRQRIYNNIYSRERMMILLNDHRTP
jgi:hypothetical protein